MIDMSKIYSSKNYGDFKIINYYNSTRVEIEFILTGFKLIARSHSIKRGMVKDKLFPKLYGVGFVGDGEHLPTISGRCTKVYDAWTGILERCYCPKLHKIHPTYIGVTATKDWHNFQNFAEWYSLNYVEGFHLDKDIKQRGVKNKIYSPETCIFVSHRDNVVEGSAKNYRVRDPGGIVYEVYNMAEFCRRNDLTKSGMIAVNSGRANHHKGWTKAQIIANDNNILKG